MEKPTRNFWQIWNMSFGFLGHTVWLGTSDGEHERYL